MEIRIPFGSRARLLLFPYKGPVGLRPVRIAVFCPVMRSDVFCPATGILAIADSLLGPALVVANHHLKHPPL